MFSISSFTSTGATGNSPSLYSVCVLSLYRCQIILSNSSGTVTVHSSTGKGSRATHKFYKHPECLSYAESTFGSGIRNYLSLDDCNAVVHITSGTSPIQQSSVTNGMTSTLYKIVLLKRKEFLSNLYSYTTYWPSWHEGRDRAHNRQVTNLQWG